jgi:hypothetical protein
MKNLDTYMHLGFNSAHPASSMNPNADSDKSRGEQNPNQPAFSPLSYELGKPTRQLHDDELSSFSPRGINEFAWHDQRQRQVELDHIRSAITRLHIRLDELAERKETIGRIAKQERSSPQPLIQKFTLTQGHGVRRVEAEPQLTADYLEQEVLPFLQAAISLQGIIDAINGATRKTLRIKSIQQNSPINVNLEGGAEALGLIRDTLIPWRVEHARAMSALRELERKVEIEVKKAEILESHSLAVKSSQEAKKISAEALEVYARAEKLQLQNQKLRIDLQQRKIDLALNVLNRLSPKLSEAEKITYLLQLLPQIEAVVGSTLTLDKVAS